MKTMKFSTNINCSNCVKAVKPSFDNVDKIESWEVNTEHPDKILTVTGEGITEEELRRIISAAGYDVIERLDKTEK